MHFHVILQDTVEECKTYCNDEATCVGFDFNSNGDQCWWHTAATLANENPGATDTTTQYVKGEEVCATPTGPGTTRARESLQYKIVLPLSCSLALLYAFQWLSKKLVITRDEIAGTFRR